MKTILSLLVAVLGSGAVMADSFFHPAVMQINSSSQQGESKTENSRRLLEAGLGQLTEKGWVIGAHYATEANKATNGTSTTDNKRTSYGPSVGVVSVENSGYYLLAHYYISSALSMDGLKNTGKGWQADLGYRFSQGGKTALALQLSYKNFEYDKQNSTALTSPIKQTYLDPYLAFWVQF